MGKKISILIPLLLFHIMAAADQDLPKKEEAAEKAIETKTAPENLSVTHHAILINGQAVNYTATAGRLHVVDKKGKRGADIFFISYARENVEGSSDRPVTFMFNGGPGASSIWLNFGAFGPKRVVLSSTGKPSGPPYQIKDNVYTLLDSTDLVFIDPVGTGFSRAAEGVSADTFYGVEPDVDVLREFIRSYVSRFERWGSPKFIAGESYGGLRAVMLASNLHEVYGMDCNGLILLSPALQFQDFVFDAGNLLPYALFLPTYTATAFYHRKLAAPLLKDLDKTLAEVEDWVMKSYLPTLIRGDALTEVERKEVLDTLATYTGLPERDIIEQKLKITNREFSRTLLRSQGRVLGILDSRLTGDAESQKGFFDEPGMVLTVGPYTSALNSHLSENLKYESDLPYRFFSSEANASWNWGSAIHGYPTATHTLAALITKFGYFKVFVARGYYDLDIGYFAARYDVDHLGLSPDLKDNVTLRYYDSGHQIYIRSASLARLKADLTEFIKGAKGRDAEGKL
jgi:carboxypeptidase C (cathepsin A)